MTRSEEIKLSLQDLIIADIKDAEGAISLASIHRACAIIRLLSICPEYNLLEEEENILESYIKEITLLGVLGELLSSPDD